MKDVYMKEIVRKASIREGKSKRKIARDLGIHRNTVSRLLKMGAQEIPRFERKEWKHRVLGPYIPLIETWLKEDEEAPRKQRHTGTRIYKRLGEEYGFTGGLRTVQEYVSKVRKKPREVFLPLAFQPGEMAQVDWAEVWVWLKGVKTKVYLFSMTLNYSGSFYFEAFERQNQESFFQGHTNAFTFFGGIPYTLTYDNLKSAVERILQGRNREENEGFVAFRTAWLFGSRFCNPARGNEKGRVENMIKFAERNLLTPVPRVDSLEELNAGFRQQCLAYQKTTQARQEKTVGERFEAEKEYLLPLPAYPPECCRIVPVKANKSALVRFDTNSYSVPSEYAYQTLWLKAFVSQVEITDQEKTIATHSRLRGKHEESIRFEHYRKVLERKPGAFEHLRAEGKEPVEPKIPRSAQTYYPKTTVHPPNLAIYRQLFRRHVHDPSPHTGNLPQEATFAQCRHPLS